MLAKFASFGKERLAKPRCIGDGMRNPFASFQRTSPCNSVSPSPTAAHSQHPRLSEPSRAMLKIWALAC